MDARILVTGNAARDGQQGGRRGWFLGHFMPPESGLLASQDAEIKWGVHPKGEIKSALASNAQAVTISILISGRFQVDLPELGERVLLAERGDYIIFAPGVVHRWTALEDTEILSVRWPSLPGDQQAHDAGEKQV